jgi:chromatin segregation and condensation protein Rec8/ScpA/Scc1 (kleisin family)
MSATDTFEAEGTALESLGAEPDERTDGLDGYSVKLAAFEGPLDLLLHLIRQNEVDITDIPIQRIAEQYLATIELMDELNLDVAAEYLVMAATLALIKSRMLLPDEKRDDEEVIDPRTDLVQRLLEMFGASSALGRRRHRTRSVNSKSGCLTSSPHSRMCSTPRKKGPSGTKSKPSR